MFSDRFLQARILTRPFLSASFFMRSLVSVRSFGGIGLVTARPKTNLDQPTVEAATVTPTATPQTAANDSALLRKRVWALAVPAIGEQLLALFVGLSDTFLTGHLSTQAIAHLGYGRADAVAAVGVGTTTVWVVLTLFFAVGVGATALVARAVGSKDQALSRKGTGQGILLGLLAGILLAILAQPMVHAITDVLGVQGDVADLAAAFLRIFSLALPAVGITYSANAAMRGAGDTRRPLTVMLLVNGTNIAASWLLMNGIPGSRHSCAWRHWLRLRRRRRLDDGRGAGAVLSQPSASLQPKTDLRRVQARSRRHVARAAGGAAFSSRVVCPAIWGGGV